MKKRGAGLRLDVPDGPGGALVATEDDVLPIKPGDPGTTEVWRRITATDKEEIMPPPKAQKTLSAVQKDLLHRWIAQEARCHAVAAEHLAVCLRLPKTPFNPAISTAESPG
jgi:hypothetical protein